MMGKKSFKIISHCTYNAVIYVIIYAIFIFSVQFVAMATIPTK